MMIISPLLKVKIQKGARSLNVYECTVNIHTMKWWKKQVNFSQTSIYLRRKNQIGMLPGLMGMWQWNLLKKCNLIKEQTIFLESIILQERTCWDVTWWRCEKYCLKISTSFQQLICYLMITKTLLKKQKTKSMLKHILWSLKINAKEKEYICPDIGNQSSLPIK